MNAKRLILIVCVLLVIGYISGCAKVPSAHVVFNSLSRSDKDAAIYHIGKGSEFSGQDRISGDGIDSIKGKVSEDGKKLTLHISIRNTGGKKAHNIKIAHVFLLNTPKHTRELRSEENIAELDAQKRHIYETNFELEDGELPSVQQESTLRVAFSKCKIEFESE